MTNFILTPGVVEFNSYPERADNGVFGSSIISDQAGDQLYLPLINTSAGTIVDTSSIGSIVPSVLANPGGNLLLCDGSSFLTSAKSAIGIPYSRLQKLLFLPSMNICQYGGGRTFVNAYITDSITNSIRLVVNAPGAQTPPADGGTPTGFTFTVISVGQAALATVYSSGSNLVVFRNNLTSLVSNPPNKTGFTITALIDHTTNASYGTFSVGTLAASAMTGGQFFQNNTGTPDYYVWVTINGVGADPAPGGTGIKVNLLSTYTATEVANCIQAGGGGFTASSIVCSAASSITAGSFFTFTANSVTYQVYYTIAGAGATPIGNPILVALTGTETSAQVATKTITAINSYMVTVPDFRGKTLQGIGSSVYDVQSGKRLSTIAGYFGNQVGTLQFTDTASGSILNGPLPFLDDNFAANDGVNWFIRY